MEKKLKKPEWHKEWDSYFKKELDKIYYVEAYNLKLTANDWAKQFIQNLLDKTTRDLFKRHNLLALSFEKIQGIKMDKARIKKAIEGNIEATKKLQEDLSKLLIE